MVIGSTHAVIFHSNKLSGVVQGKKNWGTHLLFLKLQFSETSAKPKHTVSLYFASKSLYHKGKNITPLKMSNRRIEQKTSSRKTPCKGNNKDPMYQILIFKLGL